VTSEPPSPVTARGGGPPPDGVVVVRDLWRAFGDTTVLAGVSLRVEAGQIQVIMGPSGCGKSVFLKHLVGLLKPSRGEVLVFGQPVHALRDEALDALRMRIGVVFQSAALFDSLTVADNVAFPLRRHRRDPEETVIRRVAELLDMVEMEGTERLMPSALSGGMRKRVGIARALALEPPLILYDEPTSGLDPLTARTVDDLVLRLRDTLGVTSVVVTHSVDSAFRLADRLAVMDTGRLAASGSPGEILSCGHPFVQRFLDTRTVGVGQR
jgi:phospholipid/cholesterol/gamma-HCH transport system ATP-binding protein